MKFHSSGAGALCILQGVLLLVMGCDSPPSAAKLSGRAGDSSQATAVFSKARNGYVRAKNADGSFQPESYELVAGDRGNSDESKSYDKLSLEDISLAIQKPLAIQNYVPSDDPSTTNLLILVYWGITIVPDDVHPYEARDSAYWESLSIDPKRIAAGETPVAAPPTEASMSNPDYVDMLAAREKWATTGPPPGPLMPDFARIGAPDEQAQRALRFEAVQDAHTDSRNAAILGYADDIVGTKPRDPRVGALLSELEDHRYYVVLLAFDYRMARRYGRHKLLWETRFSLTERGNDFGKELPAMALIAAKYYGQDSHGLIHNNLKEGHVEIGEPKSIGTVP